MDKLVKIVLVGIGGYGVSYVNELLDSCDKDSFKIVGVVDPYAENCPRLGELVDIGVTVFDSLNDFYKEQSADLAIISSPIQFHCKQTILSLEYGTNVLCEKPLAGSLEDGFAMAEAEKRSGKFVAIGYQWSFSDVIQDLKKDIMDGLYGRAIRLKTHVAWPRRKSYYKRNSWAGKIRTADGCFVLDSPAQNANAHYLHNMLYLLGETVNSSARPKKLLAELYRANDIENYDTVAMRVETDLGVEILFYATHAVSEFVGPIIRYEFEKGVIEFDSEGGVIGKCIDGSIKQYKKPDNGTGNKLNDCIKAVRTGEEVVCGIDAALSQLLCIDAAQASMPEIVVFPKGMVVIDKDGDSDEADTLTWVRGLEEDLFDCYNKNILPSESGEIEWADKAGKLIDITG